MTTETPSTQQAPLPTIMWESDPTDPLFTQPFVDVDELRAAPVPHRYVHGGFTGTDTRFSFYFPDEHDYRARFIQHVTPVPQSEHLAPAVDGVYNKIVFAHSSGAYFVETNGGGPDAANPFAGVDLTIGAYRANAATARFSRLVAQQVYGREHRPFGYLFGGSGGAYRTIGSSENTTGAWDGFVPYVPGSPMAIPNVFSVRMHAQRILRDVLPAIVDAYDAGGDPAALDLTDEQRGALAEVTRMGFPSRSWFGYRTMGMHAFSVLYPGVMAADPTYADDFWQVDGYLGTESTSSVHADRVRLTTTIAELITETEVVGEDLVAGGVDESFLHSVGGQVASAARLADAVEGFVLGAQLTVTTGAAAGSVIRLSGVEGDLARIEPGQEAVAALAVGNEVEVDNSSFLAAQTYHRHQVPGSEYAVWDQFRDADGEPIYPQRPMLLGPIFTQNASGALPTGRISGKVIAVSCLLDREAFPWQADWYRARVAEHVGADVDDRFRLWYIDNALHGDDDLQEFPDRTVSYLGALEAALRQLIAWVEDDVDPAGTSEYEIVDGQIRIPDDADARRGVQPTVVLTVNGSGSATVRVGEPVAARIDATAPGAGAIVEILPLLDGTGTYGETLAITPGKRVTVDQQITFDAPGTYFVAVRAAAQVDGNLADPHARVQNIARARVVVEA